MNESINQLINQSIKCITHFMQTKFERLSNHKKVPQVFQFVYITDFYFIDINTLKLE